MVDCVRMILACHKDKNVARTILEPRPYAGGVARRVWVPEWARANLIVLKWRQYRSI